MSFEIVSVNYLLSQCTQRIYFLKLLRHQGMPLGQLTVIFTSHY